MLRQIFFAKNTCNPCKPSLTQKIIQLSIVCGLSAGAAASLAIIQKALQRNGLSIKTANRIIDVIQAIGLMLRGHNTYFLALVIAENFTEQLLSDIVKGAAKTSLFAISPTAEFDQYTGTKLVLACLSSLLAKQFTLHTLSDHLWDTEADEDAKGWFYK